MRGKTQLCAQIIEKHQALCYNGFRTTVYFVFSKGVASRHLFTIIYRILCARLQNHFLGVPSKMILLNALLRSDEMLDVAHHKAS